MEPPWQDSFRETKRGKGSMSQSVSQQPASSASKSGSFTRAIGYALAGAICSAVVAALSYGLGYRIALGLVGSRLAVNATDAVVRVNARIGWGWIGAAIGTLVGLSVGSLRRRPVGLAFLGGVLGALTFMMDNPRTTRSANGLINWVTIAGIGGLIACGIAKVAESLKKRHIEADACTERQFRGEGRSDDEPG